jgi:hypothetical protein
MRLLFDWYLPCLLGRNRVKQLSWLKILVEQVDCLTQKYKLLAELPESRNKYQILHIKNN